MTMTAHLSQFDYVLPPELIAEYPSKVRSESRLLCVDRTGGSWQHRIFNEMPHFLQSGDVLVLNDTQVIPARLLGNRASGGQAEALLLENLGNLRWEALLRPAGKIKKGDVLRFGQNGSSLTLRVVDDPRQGSGMRRVEFKTAADEDRLEKIGHIPLPPYIQRTDQPEDRFRYQTIFAKNKGAVAAPTAGLHFDEPLLEALTSKGVEIVKVTLHVSYGTFQPILVEELSEYEIFEENYEVSEGSAAILNQALKASRRIIACGTTSVRTLESAVDQQGVIQSGKRTTRLFIYPPYRFRVVKGLITNFHLPRSSLLVLVAAFLGTDQTLAVYQEAVARSYRFYSYGDAMLIL